MKSEACQKFNMDRNPYGFAVLVKRIERLRGAEDHL